MILLISSLGKKDPQILLLIKRLSKIDDIFVLDTHRIHKSKIHLEIAHPGYFFINKKKHILTSIVFTTNPRIDAILNSPKEILFPNDWRLRLESFLKEFLFLNLDGKNFPGSILKIEQAESKGLLMKKAQEVGLLVPNYTKIGFGIKEEYSWYKPLGFPFSVTNKKGLKSEVTLTAFGFYGDGNDKIESYPTLVQEGISADKHVRCFCTQENIFSVFRDNKENERMVDFRELNIDSNHSFRWKKYNLSKKSTLSLFELLKSLSLTWACPEFLIRDEEEIFIDLNPCGDWYGFFNKNTNVKIVNEIYRVIIS